jgi:beta-glucosidase
MERVITTINNEANKTRLKIPVLYGIDAIHGSSYTLGAIPATNRNGSHI